MNFFALFDWREMEKNLIIKKYIYIYRHDTNLLKIKIELYHLTYLTRWVLDTCDDYVPSDKYPGIVFTSKIQRIVSFLIIFGIHVTIIWRELL